MENLFYECDIKDDTDSNSKRKPENNIYKIQRLIDNLSNFRLGDKYGDSIFTKVENSILLKEKIFELEYICLVKFIIKNENFNQEILKNLSKMIGDFKNLNTLCLIDKTHIIETIIRIINKYELNH